MTVPPNADTYFPPSRPAPPPGVFELGLVLGGTVAVGAYTAGALDFMLEALEDWHAGQPIHRVEIPFVAGASGGAICAAILGLISRKQIRHITGITDPAYENTGPTGNKLWDIWVNEVNIQQMLDTSDLVSGQPLPSLLNVTLLNNIIAEMAQYAAGTGTFERSYFPAPYRMAVTLTNTRGVPYRLDVPGIESWSGAAYVAHDDFARFAIPNGADPNGVYPAAKRPDEFWVDPGLLGKAGDYTDYTTYSTYAAASAAFPIGLEARATQRPTTHYAYRPYVQPRETGYAVDWPQPEWNYVVDPGAVQYSFTNVDGGVFNNDPVSLVHHALAGLVGENPRAPELANRALFMIDPLAPKPANIAAVGTDVLSILQNLTGFVTGGTRYLTGDMALMGDPEVFSRFQLIPTRPDLGLIGETALAGDFFEAFGGFMSRAFRRHDFLLGRINMQNYLRTTLILRGDNPLFAQWDTRPDLLNRFAVDTNGIRCAPGADKTAYYLPVIPDSSYSGEGPIAIQPDTATLPWPTDAFDPSTLSTPIKQRLAAVLKQLQQQALPGFFTGLLEALIGPELSGLLADRLITEVKTQMTAKKLLSSGT